MKHKHCHTSIELINGDITQLDVDAIVNAANGQLVHGGGVAGVIAKTGGPAIQEESNLWIKTRGPVETGNVAITSAGNLPARYIIHAVGPRQGEGKEKKKLQSATLNSLKMADSRFFKSIAFPAVSTGIFGYPMDKCAKIMLSTVKSYVEGDTGLERIVFALFGEEALSVFQKTFFKLFQD